MKKDFVSFVRTRLEPLVIRHGYRRKAGTTYELEQNQVVRSVTLLLSRDGRTFVPRFNVWLAPFLEEIGVVVLEDLSTLTKGSGAGWWRWPLSEAERARTGDEVAAQLEAIGMPWLEHLGHLEMLIEYLESRKHRLSEPATGAALVEMLTAGITVVKVPGSESTAAASVRPEVIQHLSYCYELAGLWDRALDSWKEYCRIFPPADTSEHLRKVKARLSYLSGKV